MNDDKRYPQSIMATACVPWNQDYSLDERAFRNQIRLFVMNEIAHIYLFGTAGEGYAVSDEQYKRIVRVFLDEIGDSSRATGRQADPMVGIICLSTNTALDRIRWARDLGIREFQVSLPSWGAVNDSELFTFFHAVCDPFPDCRFLHFNVDRARRLVTPREYGRLQGEVPNLAATKNFTYDIERIYELEMLAPQLTHFNGEAGFAHGCILGSPGLILTTFNSNWRRAREFFSAGVQKDWEKLFAMLKVHMEILHEMSEATGCKLLMDGAFDKLFVKLHDPLFPLRLLPPYETFDDECFMAFQSAIRRRFPQWMPDSE